MAKDKDKPAGPKARNDAYVMMLFITLVAIITGSVLMYLDNEEYGKKPPEKDVVYSPPKLGEGAPTPATAPGGGGGGKGSDPKDGDATPKTDPKMP